MSRWKYRGDDEDADDLESFQRMRKTTQTRPKASDKSSDFEKREEDWEFPEKEGFFAARIVEVHKRYAFISPEPIEGQINTRDPWLATVAKKYLTDHRAERNFVCVGDRVLCRPALATEAQPSEDLPQCVIVHAKPRTNRIARIDPSSPEREHVLASNVEQMLIVASYKSPKVKWGLIDRFLVLAESEDVVPIICLNKRDLLEKGVDDELIAEAKEREADYRKLGYEVLNLQLNQLSARSKDAKKLQMIMAGKVSMVCGHSGVGKSTLVNLFKPEIEQAVEPNSDIFYKGRHTTSFASLIRLGTGGYIVDTPGIRSFAIRERGAIELSYCFRELRPLIGKCAYRECSHYQEPDCVVRKAVEDGQIPAWRYRSYLGILSGATGREGRVREIVVEE